MSGIVGSRLNIRGSGLVGSLGTDGQVFTSAGAGAGAVFEAVGGGITHASTWRLNTGFTGSATPIASNWEQVDLSARLQGHLGSSMTESSGVFTFPSTGFYLVGFKANYALNDNDRSINNYIYTTTDNSNWYNTAYSTVFIQQTDSNWTGASGYTEALVDVQDVSNDKVRFRVATVNASTQTQGNTNESLTSATFIRLGDT